MNQEMKTTPEIKMSPKWKTTLQIVITNSRGNLVFVKREIICVLMIMIIMITRLSSIESQPKKIVVVAVVVIGVVVVVHVVFVVVGPRNPPLKFG